MKAFWKNHPALRMVLMLVLLFLGLMRVTAGTYSAFIYFQF